MIGVKNTVLTRKFYFTQVASDVPLWATLGGQDVERLPSASTCYNTLKVLHKKRCPYLATFIWSLESLNLR